MEMESPTLELKPTNNGSYPYSKKGEVPNMKKLYIFQEAI